MRLTCPNCGAQYEVPADVIPDAGRDVQCSNCGDTWFQAHPDHAVDQTDDATTDADEPEDVPADEEYRKAPAPQDADDADGPDDGADTDHDDDDDDDAAAQPPSGDPAVAMPERREIDPSIANVLREEAEHEKRAREAARTGLEMQPDLGLDDEGDEARRAREARARMARMRGEDPDTEPQDGIDPTSRRSLFPDIEEINSSLAPAGDPHGADPDHNAYAEAPTRARGGFRRGFVLALLIAVLALLLYVFAPQLGNALPALRDVLTDYVAWVDGLRQWLDGQVAALMLWLDGMSSDG